MPLNGEKPSVNYNLAIHSSNSIQITQISEYLGKLVQGKKVVAFGEEHNLNTDKTFSKVLEFADTICFIYREIQRGTNFSDVVSRLESDDLPRLVAFFEYILANVVGNIDSLRGSATRFFSCLVIGEIKKQGFTDIIVEGLSEDISLEKILSRSKDKIGMLLIVISCIFNGIKIHGIYDENPLFGVFRFAKLFEDKVDELIEKNPETKVFTYNGGVHNMTIPIEGTHKIFGAEVDLKDLTFSPSMQEKFGEKFLSIDLVSQLGGRDDSSHYNYLKNQNKGLDITLVEHSRGQFAIVFPTLSNGTQYSQRIEKLINPTA